MKIIFLIITIIVNILSFVLLLLSLCGGLWLLLPEFQTTQIGHIIATNLTNINVLVVTIISLALFISTLFLKIFTNKSISSKLKNLYIHFVTWLIMIAIIIVCSYTFIMSTDLSTAELIIGNSRKIIISICLIGIIIYYLLHKKVSKFVISKIQSYDVARETQVEGRSSVIWVNILKISQVIFPEIFFVIIICCCTRFNLSKYFIMALTSIFIPFIGNILSDMNIRKEAKLIKEQEKQELVKEIAEAIKN